MFLLISKLVCKKNILAAAFETTGYLLPEADDQIKRLLRKAYGASDENGPVTLEYVKAYSHLRMRLSTVIHQKIGEMCSVYLKYCEPDPSGQFGCSLPLSLLRLQPRLFLSKHRPRHLLKQTMQHHPSLQTMQSRRLDFKYKQPLLLHLPILMRDCVFFAKS